MFCSKCGTKLVDGSAFCSHCGASLQGQNAAQGAYAPPQNTYIPDPSGTPQGAYMPQWQNAEHPPKQPNASKKGLIIGLVIGGVVLIAAVAVLVIWLTSQKPAVAGQWYSEEAGAVLVFDKAGSVTSYTVEGESKTDYEYDSKTQEGTMSINGREYQFKIVDGVLEVEGLGSFAQLKTTADIQEYLQYILEDDGVENPNPTPTVYPQESDAQTTDPQSSAVQTDQTGILGTWYDTSGFAGIITFYEDGGCAINSLGIEMSGSYYYDESTGQGQINFSYYGTDTEASFYIQNGSLNMDGVVYTKNYVEQENLGDLIDDYGG